jgi:glucose-6-phosphate isomerase
MFQNPTTEHIPLLRRAEFTALENHRKYIDHTPISVLFKKDPFRFRRFHIREGGFLFDYSKHRVSKETMNLLFRLARSCGTEIWRDKMFSGDYINSSENRAVLHTALRDPRNNPLEIDGENISQLMQQTLKKIEKFTAFIHENKNITDVINIGIGGSDLGSRLACEALTACAHGPRIHFVSNVDPHAISSILQDLNPENTFFIVASKTFGTQEVLANARVAKKWILRTLGHSEFRNHFAAVTMNKPAAVHFGLKSDHIFPMRNWIGGRYSVWSAIGLPIALSIGFKKFKEFLNGAYAMDRHFLETPLEKNIPAIAALLGIWYRNFWDFPAHAILPYAQGLRNLPNFLQQLDMESNGKSVGRNGESLDYPTGPVIFGAAGTDSQHAFMQLLHQSAEIVPCDFILLKESDYEQGDQHLQLNTNALAQAQALMEGCIFPGEPHRNCPGNRPSSTIIMDRLDPYHLGMLLAFYEHKIFVQGIIWNINSFDQWGVELGKNIARHISEGSVQSFDSSTVALMDHLGLQNGKKSIDYVYPVSLRTDDPKPAYSA